jgi:26S proteasome regulatory subunit N8
LRRVIPSPVLIICDVKPKALGLPVDSYIAIEEIEGTETKMSFRNVPSEIGAQESEEVGVEHLLRDIQDTRISTLTGEVTGKAHSLQGLGDRIGEIDAYLSAVIDGRLPANQAVIAALQDMFNLMPNLRVRCVRSRGHEREADGCAFRTST